MEILFSSVVNVVNYTDWFLILYQLYIPGMDSTLFYILLIAFANIFLKIFIPMLMRDFAL